MSTAEEAMVIRIPLDRPAQRHISSRVEIARSFSFKMNVGNYESRDFFCSQKAECDAVDAETTSESVYQFCKSQVLKAVREYKEERLP